MCEEKGIVLNEILLRKALLIPDDLPRKRLGTKIRQPGECLQKDFWKARHRQRSHLRKKVCI